MTGNKSPIFDWDAGDFVMNHGIVAAATDADALKQIVIKACATLRGRYTVYADYDNPDLHHKYGSDAPEIITQAVLTDAVRLSELKRAVREAILYDPMINDVTDINIYQTTDAAGVAMHCVDMTIASIYDTVTVEGVALDG